MDNSSTYYSHLLIFFQVAGAVANFFYCMLLHPEVQEKLHEELDQVVGQDRLPTFDDHVNLRYFNAVRKEGNRWQPLGPIGRILIVTLIFRTDAAAAIGIPHKCKNEDTYKGYVFPANTVFIIHLWSVSRTCRKHGGLTSPPNRYVFRDPRIWEHPERYDPDRFLPEKNPNAASLPDPWETIFGFGRRRCPGQHLAHAVSLHYCAMILWAFNLRVPDGEPMPTPSTTVWRDAIVR
jgi:cytochrome P450